MSTCSTYKSLEASLCFLTFANDFLFSCLVLISFLGIKYCKKSIYMCFFQFLCFILCCTQVQFFCSITSEWSSRKFMVIYLSFPQATAAFCLIITIGYPANVLWLQMEQFLVQVCWTEVLNFFDYGEIISYLFSFLVTNCFSWCDVNSWDKGRENYICCCWRELACKFFVYHSGQLWGVCCHAWIYWCVR